MGRVFPAAVLIRLRLHVQQEARDQADKEARRIPWQLLQEARRQYIGGQEFRFWARSVMENEGFVSPWLAEAIDDHCLGFVEEDRAYAAEHADEGFGTR